jgi:hypothetical protein
MSRRFLLARNLSGVPMSAYRGYEDALTSDRATGTLHTLLYLFDSIYFHMRKITFKTEKRLLEFSLFQRDLFVRVVTAG